MKPIRYRHITHNYAVAGSNPAASTNDTLERQEQHACGLYNRSKRTGR